MSTNPTTVVDQELSHFFKNFKIIKLLIYYWGKKQLEKLSKSFFWFLCFLEYSYP
jgi:hypothetical protein